MSIYVGTMLVWDLNALVWYLKTLEEVIYLPHPCQIYAILYKCQRVYIVDKNLFRRF